MELRQYDIVLVVLDPTLSSEIKKTRPCSILSPNEMNRHLQTVVVAPMTRSNKQYPTRVAVFHDGKDGQIAIDQIRTIDRRRVLKMLGCLNESEIEQVKAVIQETFVD
ncbi:type II toxin-antitoxin system PemK/MazF family toxin [bacterium]|nr:type II toxin-antitoxin system PemK/MazF family toxin [bacterium]